MEVHEVLKYTGIDLIGYGKNFIILNQYYYSLVIIDLADLVDVEIINHFSKQRSYLLRYNSQTKSLILEKYLNISRIYYEIANRIDPDVEFEDGNIYITNISTKHWLLQNLKDYIDIFFVKEKFAWLLKVDISNMENVFVFLKSCSKTEISFPNFKYKLIHIKMSLFLSIILIIIAFLSIIYNNLLVTVLAVSYSLFFLDNLNNF